MKHFKPLFRVVLGAAVALTALAGLMSGWVAPAYALRPTAAPTIIANITLAVSIDKQTVQPGEAFDVVVKITSDQPSRGAQAALKFDPKLVDVVGVVEGDYYKTWALANGGSTVMMPSTPAPDNAQGLTRSVGVAILGGKVGDGATGSGTMLTYKLKARAGATGTAQFDLQDALVLGLDQGATPYGGVALQGAQLAIGANATPVAVQPSPVAVTAIPSPALPTLEPTVAPRKTNQAGSGVPWAIVVPIIGLVVLGGGVGVVMMTRRKSGPGKK